MFTSWFVWVFFLSAFHFLCFDGSFCLLVIKHKSSGGSLPSRVPINIVASIMEYLQFVYRFIYTKISCVEGREFENKQN